MKHRVHVALSYWGAVPYKWRGDCVCGWMCASWQWQRKDGSGALAMSNEHMRKADAL